jgi:hypothetical protein
VFYLFVTLLRVTRVILCSPELFVWYLFVVCFLFGVDCFMFDPIHQGLSSSHDALCQECDVTIFVAFQQRSSDITFFVRRRRLTTRGVEQSMLGLRASHSPTGWP